MSLLITPRGNLAEEKEFSAGKSVRLLKPLLSGVIISQIKLKEVRMIIDAHLHLGDSAISGYNVKAEDLLRAMDRAGTDSAVVQPFAKPQGPIEKINDYIAEQMVRYKNRFFGLASIDPHRGEDFYSREAERCIKELHFVGIKLHPSIHLAPINGKVSDIIFDTALRLNVPVMIHTGFGVPFTMPSLAIPRAKRYPDLKIILAHAGEYDYSEEALIVAGEYPNIYLETSWSHPSSIKRFIDTLGAGRVMLGSDLADNIIPEIAKYKSLDLSEENRRTSMSGTASELFKIVF